MITSIVLNGKESRYGSISRVLYQVEVSNFQEMGCVSEKRAMNTALPTTSNESRLSWNTSRDESDQFEKYESGEQKLKTDGSSVAAESNIVSRHSVSFFFSASPSA